MDELPADKLVVAFEQLAPGPVAERGRLLAGADYVGEEYGRQHAIGFGRLPFAGSDLGAEARQLGEEFLLIVADGRREVAARELDEPSPANVLDEVSPEADVERRRRRSLPLQNECRHLDR